MSSTAQTAPDTATEISRVFDLQREHQWDVKASTAEQRKAKLAKLKAAVEAHADDIIAAVREDTRKPEGEIRVTEVLNVIANIQRNIDNLDEWMKPTEVTPSMNPNDKAQIVYEARGVCLILGPWNFPLGPDAGPARGGGRRRQLLHGQADRPVPGDRARSPARSSARCSTRTRSRCSKAMSSVAKRCSSCRSTTSSSPAARASARW